MGFIFNKKRKWRTKSFTFFRHAI